MTDFQHIDYYLLIIDFTYQTIIANTVSAKTVVTFERLIVSERARIISVF